MSKLKFKKTPIESFSGCVISIKIFGQISRLIKHIVKLVYNVESKYTKHQVVKGKRHTHVKFNKRVYRAIIQF